MTSTILTAASAREVEGEGEKDSDECALKKNWYDCAFCRKIK